MKQEKISTRRSVRWRVSGRLLMMPIVAGIALLALFLSGCVSHRKIAEESDVVRSSETVQVDSAIRLNLDSVSEIVEIRMEPLKVPMSSVTLTIATDSLLKLPAGAVYSDRNGQASVKVSRMEATQTSPEYIYVYASCDSLQLQCERYERTIKSLRKEYGEQLRDMQNRLLESTKYEVHTIKEPPTNPIKTALVWFSIGLLSGIIGTIIILKKIRK